MIAENKMYIIAVFSLVLSRSLGSAIITHDILITGYGVSFRFLSGCCLIPKKLYQVIKLCYEWSAISHSG